MAILGPLISDADEALGGLSTTGIDKCNVLAKAFVRVLAGLWASSVAGSLVTSDEE